MGILVHDFQVGDNGIVHVLVEERGIVEHVQTDAVGDLDEVELRFLGYQVVDVRLEERVRFKDLAANTALDAGFHFGFCARSKTMVGCV